MSKVGLKGLETQLGAAVPAGLARLGSAQLDDLAAAVAEARHRQAAELEAAGDHALRHIPRLLRIAIRRVLG
jgi:hypothetical protein